MDRLFALELNTADACARGLMYYGMLRNAELRRIRLKDVTEEQILGRLYIVGRSSNERVVPLNPALWELIAAHRATIPQNTPMTRTLLAKPDGKPWTPQMLWERVRKWGRKAGVQGPHTPDRWRQTGAINALERSDTHDLTALQEVLGHKWSSTTQRYARAGDKRKAALVRALASELEDTTLDAARRLISVNLRAAGALAGVVLEEHLQRVAKDRGVKVKTNSTIGDLNDPLKQAAAYDVATWRLIQLLGDLRNKCAHKKDAEPTKDDAVHLIDGVDRVVKTIV